MKSGSRLFLVSVLFLLAAAVPARAAGAPPDALAGTQVPRTYRYLLDKLRENDIQCNTKCWGTFRQIEDVVAGRPLREDAAHRRIDIVGEFARELWLTAQVSARPEGAPVSSGAVAGAYEWVVVAQESAAAAPAPWGPGDDVTPLDLGDYARTSEAWRALLSVAQTQGHLLTRELTPAAADLLADRVNRVSVALLKKAARLSFEAGLHEVTPESLDWARAKLLQKINFDIGHKFISPMTLAVTRWYAEGKIESLQRVNAAAGGEVHRRTLEQIAGLPLDAAAVEELDRRVMPGLSRGLWLEAQEGVKNVISGDQMAEVIYSRYPHRLDEVENIEFFPDRPRSYFLFAHEADSVRDDAQHWRIVADLASAGTFRSASPDVISQGLDPYAAEELTELVSNLAALVVKLAGERARAAGAGSVGAEAIRGAAAEIEQASRSVTPQEVSSVWGTPAPAPGDARPAAGKRRADGRSAPVFADVTEGSGFSPAPRGERRETMTRKFYRGVAVEDFDRDGYPDVWMEGLFRNLGGFRFKDVTAEAGFGKRYGFAAFGDFDNDGWPDLCAFTPGAKLYRNNGDGTFEDVSAKAGLFANGAYAKPLWLDYDLDGDLDIHIVYLPAGAPRLGDSQTAGVCQLFRNDGGGVFTEVSREAGLTDRRSTHAAATLDFDLDGDPDIFHSNDFGQDMLYENLGDGRFRDVSVKAGVADQGHGMGVSVADFDRDGWPDMYTTNIGVHSPRVRYIRPNARTELQTSEYLDQFVRLREANRLYRNNRDGTFTDVVKDVMEPVKTGWGWNGFFFDYDNDGHVDIHVQNGFGAILYDREPDVLIRFDPDAGKFRDASAGSGVDVPSMERTGTYADFDRDGFLDLLVAESGGARVLKNLLGGRRRPHNWLAVKLEGTRSNRDALGARVRVVAGGAAQTDWLGGQGGGLASHGPRELHFGLGRHRKAESVEILWPSGAKQTLKGVKAGRRLVVLEPAAPGPAARGTDQARPPGP